MEYSLERERERENSRLKPVWLIVLALISGYIAYSAGRAFYITWEASSQLKAILSRFTTDTDSLLNILCNCGAAASFPAVFALIRLLFDYVRKIIPFIRDEYSIKPLFSGRSAFAKSAGIVILNLIAAVILGVILLTAVYSLPIEKIDENVRNSAPVLQQEGESSAGIFSWCTSKPDNFTDAIMLMEAVDDSEGSPLERALMAYKGQVDGKNAYESLIAHYISGAEYTGKISYSRYWHGYQLFVKPLLEFMDYGGIRALNLIIQAALTILVAILLAKRNKRQFILPYLCVYLMLNPYILGISLQFSSCFYALTFGCLALLLLRGEKRSKYAFLIFLNIGIFTAYFDFLTYPMAAFGIPAVLYTALQGGDSLEKKLNDLIRCGITWCIGYGGMWISKWVVTYLLTGYNAIAEGLNSLSIRTSNTNALGSTSPKATGVLLNYGWFLFTPVVIICIVLAVFLIKNIKTSNSSEAGNAPHSAFIPYALLSCAPVVWYAFATNHSILHLGFTNKSCAVTMFAILCGLADVRKESQ